MNPFKFKQLDDFTIEDCELYISRYPYGEHTIEVKRLLKELKKQKAEQPPTGLCLSHNQHHPEKLSIIWSS